MIIETWTEVDQDGAYNTVSWYVARFVAGTLIEQIQEVISKLPSGTELWETVLGGPDYIEMVFRSTNIVEQTAENDHSPQVAEALV